MKLVSFSTGGGSCVGGSVVEGAVNLTLEFFSLAMDLISSIVLPLSANMRRTVRVLCRGILEIQQRESNKACVLASSSIYKTVTK